MAGIICKNLISNRSTEERYTDLWLSLEPTFKVNIKQAVLAQLACKSQPVRSALSALVAAIAGIELPKGEWHDLIPLLCNNAGHQDQTIKLTSL